MHLRDLPLVEASVAETATLLEAGRTLAAARTAAIAVLRPDRTVAGLFTDDDVLRGIFSAYVQDLHHTAFVEDVGKIVGARLEVTAGDPVILYMRPPQTVELETSALHVSERFLHCPWGALAVVDEGRFVGMLREVDFVDELLRIV
jgi:CBS domain-containing protein